MGELSVISHCDEGRKRQLSLRESCSYGASGTRKRHTPRFFPARSRAHFRVFSRLASLASLVVGLTFTVEVTLNKLLKDSGVLGSRDCD